MCRTLRVLVSVSLVLALTACQPTVHHLVVSTWAPDGTTGHALCDRQHDILGEIEDQDFTVDCTPDFAPYAAGDRDRPIWGWTDHQRRTVWLWPERWSMTDLDVRVGLYHELHHVLGGRDETQAILYSWCRERPPGGFALLDATPTDARCAQVGA